MAIVQAFDLLTNAMSNPMRSVLNDGHICADKMKTAAEVIDKALIACASREERIALVKAHPKYLRAGIRYLTEGRDNETCGRVIIRAAMCRCGVTLPSNVEVHEFATMTVTRGISKLGVVINTVCECLVLALSELKRGRYHPSDAHAGRPWPIRADDLLPFGVEAALCGIRCWMNWLREVNTGKQYVFYKLLEAIIRLHVPFANTLLNVEKKNPIPYNDTIIDLARVFLTENGRMIGTGPTAFPRTPEEIRDFCERLSALINFYMSLRSFSGIKFLVVLKKHAENLALTLMVASSMMTHLPPAWNGLRADVDKLAALTRAMVKAATPKGQDIGSGTFRYPREMWNADLMDLAGSYGASGWVRPGREKLFEELVRMRRRERWCASIGCPPWQDGASTRLCSQCDFVRFCRVECSKQAWKSEPLPHKKLCPIIARLRQRIGDEDWARMWAPGFTTSDFEKLCVTKNVDLPEWEVVHSAMSGLKKCRYMHRGMTDDGIPEARARVMVMEEMRDFFKDHGEIYARLSGRPIN